MAAQAARHLGAGKIVGVGRNSEKLGLLNTDTAIALDEAADEALRAEFGRGVDVVLDFIWGEPAMRVMAAATAGRGSRSGEPRLRYVQIGTAAGNEIPLRGDALRSSGLELLGSGIGSVAVRELLAGPASCLPRPSRRASRRPSRRFRSAQWPKRGAGPVTCDTSFAARIRAADP